MERVPLAFTLAALVAPAGCDVAPIEPVDHAALAQAELRAAWAVTAPMSVAREGHTATRLAGGAVLIAGGKKIGAFDTGDVFFRTAELYDPAAGAFAPAASMVDKRVDHAAALLPGGKVLVVGGSGDTTSATTSEIFDPSKQTWSATPAPLAHGRVAALLSPLLDGRVLVAGGDTDPSASTAEIFIPATGVWITATSMKSPRRRHTATLLSNGRVMIAGGRTYAGTNKDLATVEIYVPTTNTWLTGPPMTRPRSSHTATRLGDDRVLVAGGSTDAGVTSSAEIYDPGKGTWTEIAPMESARATHTATKLDNGAVLVAGGVDETSSVLRAVELFDPLQDRWIPIGPMTHGRLAHAAAPLEGGGVLVAGGENQSSAEIYQPAAVGDACTVGFECASGHCADGVCCDEACEGTCRTCAREGSRGTCGPAAPGTDLRRECGAGGPCDDACNADGVCADRIGQVCAPPSCDADGRAIDATCVERGGACPSTPVDCAPYLCGARPEGTLGCLARCASVDDCAPGYACDTRNRCVPRPDAADRDAPSCAASSSSSSRARWAAIGAALAMLALALRRRS